MTVNGNGKARETIQTLLNDTGVQTDAVSCVEEALNLLQEDAQRWQLLILAWEPPEVGIQAAERLRQALPETALLLILADYDAEGTEEALRLSRTGVLAKPFFVSALQEKVLEMQKGTPADGAEQNSLEGMHFLAAEDNEINAEILAELLEIEGAGCEIVENGQLAVERYERAAEGEFDAILMDVQMPMMNGYSAARAIRALEKSRGGRIPIIAMTANAFAEDEKAALDAGMDAHVPKPLDVELLKQVIRQHTREGE